MKITAQEFREYTLVEFDLDGIAEPYMIEDLNIPKINNTKGVVISGDGPDWLYTHLSKAYHEAVWVATTNPRLGYSLEIR